MVHPFISIGSRAQLPRWQSLLCSIERFTGFLSTAPLLLSRALYVLSGSLFVWALLDAMVDFTLELVACYDESIHDLQKEMLLVQTQKSNFSEALARKKSLLDLRSTIWRMRELVTELKENEFSCFTPVALDYLSATFFHCENMVQILTASIGCVEDVMTLYRQNVVDRTGKTLSVLTFITLMLMPGQFITSFYGTRGCFAPG
jgi:magnesium transporter